VTMIRLVMLLLLGGLLTGCPATPSGSIVQTGDGDCVVQGSGTCAPQPKPIVPIANPNPTTTCAGDPVTCSTAESRRTAERQTAGGAASALTAGSVAAMETEFAARVQ